MMRQIWKKVVTILFAMAVFLLPAAWAADGSGTITIVHTNDMHGRIMTDDDSGSSIGLPEISAAVQAVRQENRDTLFIDAGDTLHGMPVINISRGANMVKLMNEMGYDYMVPGNHDFNYGEARLQELAKGLHFPMLSANIVDKRNGKLLFTPYKQIDRDGIKIAIFGLTTPEAVRKTAIGNFVNAEILDPIGVSRDLVKKLRAQNDVIVAVTHIGLDKSSVITTDQLAQAVPGIDVIIDGHSHTAIENGLVVGGTLIAQTGYHEHNLGRVDITVKDHKIINKHSRLYTEQELKMLVPEPDPVIANEISRMVQKNKALFDQVVTTSPVTLTGDREYVRAHETELGNLATDAIRWATKADIAMINGGNIRADLKKGTVTKGDIMRIFPFGSTVVTIHVSGADLQAALEQSVGAYPVLYGGFLQVSGISFSFDPAQPKGHRVSAILVGGQPLDTAWTYVVAVNDFLAKGGDGYTMFAESPVIGECGTYEEIIGSYLNTVKNLDYKLGRVTLIGAALPKAA